MTPTCYAQRLLNPFRGVMNIIEHEGAEAVTTDGLHWDIYVRDTTLAEDFLAWQAPFDEHPDMQHYAEPPPDWAGGIQVSCSS